jgi:hypothetical protein
MHEIHQGCSLPEASPEGHTLPYTLFCDNRDTMDAFRSGDYHQSTTLNRFCAFLKSHQVKARQVNTLRWVD